MLVLFLKTVQSSHDVKSTGEKDDLFLIFSGALDAWESEFVF